MNHIIKISSKPALSGKSSTPDGAYNGNGDLAVILGSCENGLRIYISKIDLWHGIDSHDRGGLKPFGYVDIPINAVLYDNYYAEQDMDKGEIRCSFKYNDKECSLKVKVCKDENLIVIENTGNVDISPVLKAYEGESEGEKGDFTKDDISYSFRSFDAPENKFTTHCIGAMKNIQNKYCIFVATNHDIENDSFENLKSYVKDKTVKIDSEYLVEAENKHFALWKNFYSKSSMKIDDEFLELRWYASQYFLACGCGNGKFAPGLFANYVTVENPSWHSDYHLNYNYQAPFYAVCSSNHPELLDSYHIPLEEFMENGKKDAEKFGCKGIIYPVGIGPKGIYTEYTPSLPHWFERLFLGQKSNAIHPADLMVFRWRATRDIDYARDHAYPFVKECIQFFEDYAVFEKGRFWIKDDAVHEVPMYRTDYNPKKREYRFIHDTNNCLTLGLLRLCIPAAIDMAKELNVDEDKQKQWQNFLDKLSPFPTTFSRFGKIYRYTEKGMRNNDGNDVGLQHIYPANQVGFFSDEKQLKIAQNTVKVKRKSCYHDDNAVSSYYAMCVHTQINPKEILENLKEDRKMHEVSNLLYNSPAGGYEFCSIVANTINEMVLQSFQDVIRIFPNWDMSIDCEYKNLRADGAFLVSSSVKRSKIKNTVIISEKGGTLRIYNPYKKANILFNNVASVSEEEIITLETAPGDIISLN